MRKKTIDISTDIDKLLSESGLKFRKDVIVGSASADYFVNYNGGTALFVVKPWDPRPENLQLSFDLSKTSTSGSGVDKAYIIIPELETNFEDKGVISSTGVKNLIASYVERKNDPSITEGTKKEDPKIIDKPKDKIFAIMPFKNEYLDTFYVAMQPAALSVKAECIRADHPAKIGDIIEKIKEDINNSIAVIADISESRPNVLYELGYATAKDKKIIQICSTPFDEIPFDIRNNHTIRYTKGNTSELKRNLEKSLLQIRR